MIVQLYRRTGEVDNRIRIVEGATTLFDGLVEFTVTDSPFTMPAFLGPTELSHIWTFRISQRIAIKDPDFPPTLAEVLRVVSGELLQHVALEGEVVKT